AGQRRPEPSDVLHLEDFVAARTAGGGDLDGVTHFLADQGAGDGGGDRDAAVGGVRLGIADDLVLLFLFGVVVDDLDRGAELHRRARKSLGIDDLGERQQRFQLLDAAFVEALLLLGGMVFGVLRQVAMGARFGDRGNDRRTVL